MQSRIRIANYSWDSRAGELGVWKEAMNELGGSRRQRLNQGQLARRGEAKQNSWEALEGRGSARGCGKVGGGKTDQLGDVARERHKQGTWEVWRGQQARGHGGAEARREGLGGVGRCASAPPGKRAPASAS